MISNTVSSPVSIVVLCLACLLGAFGVAGAASITGSVENGTTGTVVADAEVSLVNPSAGMKTEQTVFAAYGRYSFENVAPGTYLVQCSHNGVSYRQSAQLTGDQDIEVKLNVFDAAQSWDGVRVEVPHFTAKLQGDHLTIERVYDIFNESRPPKTVAGEGAWFQFQVPDDLHGFHTLYASYDGVPVERQPVDAGDGKSMRVEYPVRPGLTRMAMSYEVGYHDSAYEFNEAVYYDTDRFTVFSTDSHMSVTSSSHTLTRGEGANGVPLWTIANLKKGDVINLRFSGGHAQPAAAGGPKPTIVVIPDHTKTLSILIMIILGLALLAFFSVASREQHTSGAQAEQLEKFRQVLITRLARLDDVYESGAIPGGAYHSKRQELKNQIASLMMHIKRTSGKNRGRRKNGSREKRSSNA
jgi:hypothetical protein